MKIKITTWRQVLIFSSLITALAVSVSVGVVLGVTYDLPRSFKFSALAIAGLIPLFIAFPISIFALQLFKKVNHAIEKVESLIKFDALTGVLSRAHFIQVLEEQRSPNGFLMILDADHFKKINDTYGHEAGDFALKHMARIIKQVVGNYGFVGRMGGEEFAIYLSELDRSQVVLLATAVGSALRNQTLNYNSIAISVTMSIGIAGDKPKSDLTAVFRKADILLYQAKRNGRDRFEIEDVLDEKSKLAA